MSSAYVIELVVSSGKDSSIFANSPYLARELQLRNHESLGSLLTGIATGCMYLRKTNEWRNLRAVLWQVPGIRPIKARRHDVRTIDGKAS